MLIRTLESNVPLDSFFASAVDDESLGVIQSVCLAQTCFLAVEVRER